MLIYFLIFISKIIEISLSTLRIIVISNGKKKLGAILQGLVALIWIFTTGIVVIDINKDIFKIIFFSLGSIAGSYLGSVIEEKIALGSNVLMCIIDSNYENKIKEKLREYNITTIKEKNEKYSILIIFIKRKEVKKISNIIKSIDSKCIIISEKAKYIETSLI